MCLWLNLDKKSHKPIKMTKDSSFAKKINDRSTDEITCWKVYNKKNKTLSSACQGSIIRKSGVIKSNREKQDLNNSSLSHGRVHRGIHVFIDKNKAIEYRHYNNQIIVPVICRKSDLVAEGDNRDAVFMKVRIRTRTWNTIFKN